MFTAIPHSMRHPFGCLILVTILLTSGLVSCESPEKKEPHTIKALILDGHNNHYVWPKTSQMMKSYLDNTGLFSVDILRMDSVWLGIKYNLNRPEAYPSFYQNFPLSGSESKVSEHPVMQTAFQANFDTYDVIISNLGAETPTWPQATQAAFERYMQNGGGLVLVHAANNAWGNWEAFNRMIGLGAWGGRDSTNGPFVYYDEEGNLQADSSAGICGSHGLEHNYLVINRAPEHPIMQGIPLRWLHAQDELYDRMRGPFSQATILATAYSDSSQNAQLWEPKLPGSGQHVPVALTVRYGQGRIFHTTMGHFDYSMECVGFITLLQRGAEWAATGMVSVPVPEDFPTAEHTQSRTWSPKAKE